MQISNKFKNLLLIIIFLLPLIGGYKGLGYEQIKVLFFIVSVSLMGLFQIKKQIKWTGISKVAGLFILVLWFTALTGINPLISILGNYPYFQGAILYLYLFLFFLIVKSSNIILEQWAKVLASSAIIVGLFAIKDWVLFNIFHQMVPTYAGRVVSTFGQPNFYAGYLLLTLPFSYFLFNISHNKSQLLGWITGLISLTGIFVSYSRSAILLALFLFTLALLDQLKIKLRWISLILGVVLVSILLALRFSSGFLWKEFLQPTSIKNPDLTIQSVESRAYIWPQVFKVGLERSLIGYGLENISSAFSDYFQTNKHSLFEENLKISAVLISLKELNIDRTHNYMLDLFLFSGLLGVGWLGLVILLFKKSYKQFLIIPLLTYLIWIQFQNQSIVHLVYFWLVVGLIDKMGT